MTRCDCRRFFLFFAAGTFGGCNLLVDSPCALDASTCGDAGTVAPTPQASDVPSTQPPASLPDDTSSTPSTSSDTCASAPRVDGVASESAWSQASQRIDKLVDGAGADPGASFSVYWNAEALFVLIEVADGGSAADSADPWDDSAIELYLDVQDDRGAAYPLASDDFQFVARCQDAVPWESSARTAGVRFACTQADGYIAEIAVPWSLLGKTPALGLSVGLDVAIDVDRDGGGRDAQWMWSGTTENWRSTAEFGEETLVAGCATAARTYAEMTDGAPPATSADTTAASSTTSTSTASGTRIIFLHHSTGGVIWNGGVSDWMTAYNSTSGTEYAITEQAFPKDSPYGWNNYPYDYWNIWVNHAGPSAYMEEPTLEMLTGQYDVVMWKHCFPVSGVLADTGAADITSSRKSLENYKLQYAALKEKMHAFPNTRFVVWTGAALRESETTPEEASRAQAFFDWVKNAWDEPGDNIFVWDFRQLETGGGLYLLPENASGDSHPNSTFAATVAPYLGQRLVDVIEGRGDEGSLTGQ